MIDGDIYRQMGSYRYKFVSFYSLDDLRIQVPTLMIYSDIIVVLLLPYVFIDASSGYSNSPSPWSSSIVAVFLLCLVTCISSQQLLLVPRFLVCSPANSDCPGSEMRHIAIGGFVAQINDLGNASMRRAFISKLVAFSAVQTSFVVRHFEVTLLRRTTSLATIEQLLSPGMFFAWIGDGSDHVFDQCVLFRHFSLPALVLVPCTAVRRNPGT